MLNVNLSTTLEQSEQPIDDDTKYLSVISFQINKKIDHGDTTRAQKLQILTLVLDEWPRRKVAEVFDVNEHTRCVQ